jgi:hypothetical protein
LQPAREFTSIQECNREVHCTMQPVREFTYIQE